MKQIIFLEGEGPALTKISIKPGLLSVRAHASMCLSVTVCVKEILCLLICVWQEGVEGLLS